MSNLIDRQAAIDAIVHWSEIHAENPDGDDCILIISELPSAQPEIIAWEELSKVYNMPDVPDKAKEIIGNLMLALDDDGLIKQRL